MDLEEMGLGTWMELRRFRTGRGGRISKCSNETLASTGNKRVYD
jgi:hypothetical protein